MEPIIQRGGGLPVTRCIQTEGGQQSVPHGLIRFPRGRDGVDLSA